MFINWESEGINSLPPSTFDPDGLIEFSKKDSTYFGLIEIDDGIRVLGNISSISTPKIGQLVKMTVSFNSKPHYSFLFR